MFQFPGLALCVCRVTVLQTAGLSHSEILGSMVICTYPRLIAAYHVLHRLHEPRHPPCALSYFLYDIHPFLSITALDGRNRSYFQLYWSWNSLLSIAALGNSLKLNFKSYFLQFVLCQYVKDLLHLPFTICIGNATWRITDSNRWPPACKAGALANWANPPNFSN